MSLQELGAHASVGDSILCERTTKLDMGHCGPPTQHYVGLRHWSSPAELRGSLPLRGFGTSLSTLAATVSGFLCSASVRELDNEHTLVNAPRKWLVLL